MKRPKAYRFPQGSSGFHSRSSCSSRVPPFLLLLVRVFWRLRIIDYRQWLLDRRYRELIRVAGENHENQLSHIWRRGTPCTPRPLQFISLTCRANRRENLRKGRMALVTF